MLFTTLLQLQKDGTLKSLVRAGLLSSKVFQYLEIYLWIDVRLKTNSFLTMSKAVGLAEEQFGVCRSTIWRAVRAMRTLNQDSVKTQTPQSN